MKKLKSLLLVIFATVSFVQAQDKPASPKAEVEGSIGAAKVKIVYCQPSAKGRKIMGGLVPFGEVWRTGANEATTIEFDKAVKIEDKDLPAGKYELFTIPNTGDWTIIFQKYGKQWGAYSYKKENDVLRVTVKPAKTDAMVETFNIAVGKDDVELKWENTLVAFKVK
ncbi:MAG TPA: DUF2911 domain-containing protein [Cyclobacteriaceae bacterium]|jgi:hypothetical protein|nr:DUF2911 domain-containing protein [Cyclobacteriaceae bacterium]